MDAFRAKITITALYVCGLCWQGQQGKSNSEVGKQLVVCSRGRSRPMLFQTMNS